ncbi:DUF4097 family beta strand repeat-containing protein [Adlercreutzia sp. ZJ154]|uniref:DUF4097 family beta strand repeat-containing protein n=1 Tax=Adlercreutzia sp. ZJ154 TaxID=2709790 RepID=UPI0013EC70FA|nr:DUF4097 family beta strand repeat-containing protein [Adlercreutzia sp. ZJ154]
MTKLTKATYVKISLVILLCLVLCGGIFSCSVGCSHAFQQFNKHFMTEFDAAQFENLGSANINADDIKNIELQWLAGAVDVVLDESNSNEIVLSETSSSRMPERQKMRWRVHNNTLQVAYGWEQSWLVGCSATSHKNLTLTIPKTLGEHLDSFTLQAASGTYNLGSIGCDSLKIDLASGNVNSEKLRANKLQINVASGDANIRGVFSQLVDLDIASGGINLTCLQECPSNANLQIASGNVDMTLPTDSSFLATVDKMSGSFTCNFPTNSTQQNDNVYKVGSGKSNFNVFIASGRVTFNQA